MQNKLCSISLLALLPLASAWSFTVYSHSECETTPSASYTGTGDTDCAILEASHRGFEIADMGNCELYLFSANDDTCADDDAQQWYDATNEDVCIPPMFTWDSWIIIAC